MAKHETKKNYLWKVLAGLLVVAGAIYIFLPEQPVASYTEDEVVRNQPFKAIHEMADGPPIPFLAKDKPQPRIVIPTSTHDFGAIGPKDIVTYSFTVRNEGDAPLTISRAYTTCGCTTAEFTARVIPPNKLTLVTLTFNAGFHDARGQQVKRGVVIENNDRDNPEVTVWTKASIGY